jgi:hypothetical protein
MYLELQRVDSNTCGYPQMSVLGDRVLGEPELEK